MSKISEHNVISGHFNGNGLRFALVCGRFNAFITDKLLEGALDALVRHDVKHSDIHVAWVPGAFEIPFIAQQLALSKKVDSIITLGAVIRGATSHYDHVANEVSKGVAQVALNHNIPVIFGVLTTNSIEEAIERAGTKAGNKGFEAAMAALEMCNLMRAIK